MAVVLVGGGAALPAFPGGAGVPCRVPEGGEPVPSLMDHGSGLSQGERLCFEQGILAGDTVRVPHEALSDSPAFLALPRLRRRFRGNPVVAESRARSALKSDALERSNHERTAHACWTDHGGRS